MLDAFISSFALFDGGWGPALDEKRDAGKEIFYYPVLIPLHGIFEMVMGTHAPCKFYYSNLRQNTVTFMVIPFTCLSLTKYIIHYFIVCIIE